MCSSAWGAIIGFLKMSKKGGGGIVLAAMSEEAKAGFYMANFDEIIDSYQTVEKAIAALSK
jgi:anti-anti-sigma regulatory factor